MEKAGMYISIAGAILSIIGAMNNGGSLSFLFELGQIPFWGGLALWGLAQSRKSKNDR